jgi:hypothetical protein
MSAMPYFDDFDLSTVDILLISQYVLLIFLLQRIVWWQATSSKLECIGYILSVAGSVAEHQLSWLGVQELDSFNQLHIRSDQYNSVHSTYIFLTQFIPYIYSVDIIMAPLASPEYRYVKIRANLMACLVSILITQQLCPMFWQRQTFVDESS